MADEILDINDSEIAQQRFLQADAVARRFSYANDSGVALFSNADINPFAVKSTYDAPARIIEEETGKTIAIADEYGHIAQYPGAEDDAKRELVGEAEADPEAPRSVIGAGIESFKYMYSSALLIISLIIVHAAIFTNQTTATGEMGIHPVAAFFIFWFLIIWLAMIEGGQGAVVGLQPIDKSLYAETHPRTLKITTMAHKGDNMERFIVGRQYLVILVITVINLVGSAIADASVFEFPTWMNEIFLGNGVAMMLLTMVGQLTAQVNSANCMLDFVNNYFMIFTSYVALGIEFSGLLHCVYLVQMIFAKITGTPIESDEPSRSVVQNLFFWARLVMSVAILGFCFAVTLVALFDGKTDMWEGIPPYASVIVLIILMAIVGMMEGIQIALFAVVNLPEEELKHHPIAQKNCELTFRGSNLQSFLIGRQIFVATCTFIVVRIASPSYTDEDDNILGVSDGFQAFLNTGLTGAVITTIVGSLAWRIVASSFPVAFLSNPLVYVIVRICLVLDTVGICSSAWLLALTHKLLVGYQVDEVYIGISTGQTAAAKSADEEAPLQEVNSDTSDAARSADEETPLEEGFEVQV